MNLYVLNPDIGNSVSLLIAISPSAADTQLQDCCKILAAVDYRVFGATHMLRVDNQPYARASQNQKIVTATSKSWRMWHMTRKMAKHLAYHFPNHQASHSFRTWDGMIRPMEHLSLSAPYTVCRRGLDHVEVLSIEEYVSIMKPYFMSRIK